MISPARASSECGTVRLSALAVLRLIANSYLPLRTQPSTRSRTGDSTMPPLLQATRTAELDDAVRGAHIRFGSKADMCAAKGHVRFTPESDIKCDIWNVR